MCKDRPCAKLANPVLFGGHVNESIDQRVLASIEYLLNLTLLRVLRVKVAHIHTTAGARMRLALYQPDIPQNTGTILRLSACLGVPIDLIGPAGFDFSDRSFRRAGLDYLDHVEISRHESFAAFEAGLASEAPAPRLVLLTTQAEETHVGFSFRDSDVLLLGRESAGVPETVHERADARVRIPMRSGLRSLNVAVAAAIVLGEALRQTGGYPD